MFYVREPGVSCSTKWPDISNIRQVILSLSDNASYRSNSPSEAAILNIISIKYIALYWSIDSDAIVQHRCADTILRIYVNADKD